MQLSPERQAIQREQFTRLSQRLEACEALIANAVDMHDEIGYAKLAQCQEKIQRQIAVLKTATQYGFEY